MWESSKIKINIDVVLWIDVNGSVFVRLSHDLPSFRIRSHTMGIVLSYHQFYSRIMI